MSSLRLKKSCQLIWTIENKGSRLTMSDISLRTERERIINDWMRNDLGERAHLGHHIGKVHALAEHVPRHRRYETSLVWA